MTLSLQDIPLAVLLGIGATAVMDAWLLLLKKLGVPTPPSPRRLRCAAS
mgnify:CR=1 FL=1